MYLKLKITGKLPVHNRLPGEEFFVRADDAARPANSLWAKRVAEEAQHGEGYVTVIERVDALPVGETAIDEPAQAAAMPPVAARPPLAPVADTGMETRIMEAVARALAGIRAEVGRIQAPSIDTKPLTDHLKIEVDRAAQRCAQVVADERIHMALISDAWRVRKCAR